MADKSNMADKDICHFAWKLMFEQPTKNLTVKKRTGKIT